MSNLITSVLSFNNDARYSKSISLLMIELKKLIRDNDFKQIDSYIEEFIKNKFSYTVCLGFLTITNDIKSELLLRTNLVSYTNKILSETHTEEEIKNLLKDF